MKRFRRISALLALVMLLSLALAGCGKKEEPIAADQVAEAMFDLSLKGDAAKVVEVFGYADETEAFSDWGLTADSYVAMIAEELFRVYSDMGYTATIEDIQMFAKAQMEMVGRMPFSARVKESDEKSGIAVVTCTVDTIAREAWDEVCAQAAADVISQLPASSDMGIEAVFGSVLRAASADISKLGPTGQTADFDVDFELTEIDISGKTRRVWLPRDGTEFGNQAMDAVLNG